MYYYTIVRQKNHIIILLYYYTIVRQIESLIVYCTIILLYDK
ncbi:hypothetical protein SIPHO042v1_p0035 [Vibrio phage 70E37.1]|nr:hypothetical protein SIPHO042v1_p0035 [Vibrio phage 70E37.1]